MRLLAKLAASLMIAALGTAPALAQDAAANFPTRAVKIVVPWPAGGATDLSARLIADRLSADWKQPVLIENVAGATGIVGTTQVSRAAPDGYTLLMATGTTNTLLPHLRKTLSFDGLKDFNGISMIIVFPNMLAVRPDLPVKTTADLVKLLKENPNKYTFGSSGHGSSIHLGGELFMLETGTKMRHIPFTGAAPALTALLGGHVDMMFDNMLSVLPYVKEGKLRGLGITSLERLSSQPDMPTLAETIPGLEITAWAALLAPAGTPEAIRDKVSKKVAEILKDPEVVKRFEQVGALPQATSPADTDAYLKTSYDKWGRIVQAANIAKE
jgi:tripartite-type tricarboxylate transporter receptor subunit TctC